MEVGVGCGKTQEGKLDYCINITFDVEFVYELKTYTVSFDASGGSPSIGSVTKRHGGTVTIPTATPAKVGYTFQGWGTYSGDTTVNYKPGDTYSSNSNATLYAIYKKNTYTVSYSANGGSGAPSAQTKTHGVPITLSSTVPKRTGCKYPCYAMMMAKRFGNAKTYEDWCEPKLAKNALEILDAEIPRLKEKIKSVQLCFTTDPFMYGYDEVSDMSIKIIKKLNDAGIKCTALTKGILPIELASLSKENEYGITLVSLDENFRKEMEPNTAPFDDRIKALKALHEAGCKTWVSIEPYPTPNIVEQEYSKILEAIGFCDKIIFGRLNYNKKVSEYKDYKKFFNELAKQTIEFCMENNKQYHIKEGTITE